jgi:predicted RNase H-like HicB family nuclease
LTKYPDRYAYPAIFIPCDEEDGGGYEVRFPDLENCFTAGDTVEEAVEQAKYVLEDCLYHAEKNDEPTRRSTPLEEVACPKGGLKQLVVAVMPPVRRAWSNRAVKKTLTIPAWLDELAKEQEVNFSQILQSALKEELGVAHHRV